MVLMNILLNDIACILQYVKPFASIFATAITTFFGAYIGARLAHKNSVKGKFYDNKTNVYLELSKALPIMDELFSQSDYFLDNGVGGSAETKIKTIEAKIEGTKEKLRNVNKDNVERLNELKTEINNLTFIKQRHEEYLSEREKLFRKFNEFRSAGYENELRLFSSSEVWDFYYKLYICLENEYKTNIGITNDDIICLLQNLIKCMRDDLNKSN